MRHFALFPALACTVALSCSISSLEMAGGSTSTPNERVMGTLFFSTGAPAPRTVVRLIPSTYDQIKGIPLSSLPTDTTDDSGAYSFATVDSGTYTIQAVQLDDRTRSLITGIHVDRDTIVVPADTLRVPGTIKLFLPPGINSALGYIYIPGTSYTVFLNNRIDFIVLDSVPANVIPALSYSTIQSTSTTTIRYSISINSHDTTVVWNPLWKFARTLVLNTTVAGADVSGDVPDFPVLVRLKSGNFDFSQEKTGGADIRFTKPDNTFLPYEIERWDSVNRQAEIWVKADTVYGSDSMQSITMYWGNPNAASESNGAAVFDTAAGFAGVWHMGQPGGATLPDATANGINATATATATAAGAIGSAQSFNGISGFVRASGPAADKLNFPENGAFSVSAWVKTNVLDGIFHGIVYKSNFQYGLQLRPTNIWEFCTYVDQTRWEMSRSPATDNSWHALVGVRDGSKQYLYVDGICVDSSIVNVASNLARAYDQPLDIGHCPDGGADPDRFFNGIIDEVRISSAANSADWIKLCYMNQKEQDALVKW